MQFSTHPLRIKAYRDVKPACAGIPNFLCKSCGRTIYTFAGRKRVHQGWKCAECAK